MKRILFITIATLTLGVSGAQAETSEEVVPVAETPQAIQVPPPVSEEEVPEEPVETPEVEPIASSESAEPEPEHVDHEVIYDLRTCEIEQVIDRSVNKD